MTRYRNFHKGEATMQAAAGVDTATFDRMVDEPFRPALSASEIRFVDRRTFSVAATVDLAGRPWASPLIGRAGELFAVDDPTTVRVAPAPIDGDPLLGNIASRGELGILYFDPSRRRRAKSMGVAAVEPDGTITYRMRRNFGLCTKYIFKRDHEMTADAPPAHPSGPAAEIRPELTDDDRAQLEAADTIFLASHHVDHGPDATHRGGPAGFVTVIDPSTLAIPDYVGNGMFQTLGNLLLDDGIGLLAIDFSSGRTLQLTGRGATADADGDDPYAERMLMITIDEVRVSHPAIGQWTDVEAFELRPGLANPGTPHRDESTIATRERQP